MGLIAKILTAPLLGPARGGWWVIEQVIGAAEAERYDEGRIMAALRDLAADLEEGRVSAEEHAEAEAVLLDQLMEARAHARAQEETM